MGLLAVTLTVALVYGGYWLFYGRYFESTNDAYLQADSVTVAPMVNGYVQSVLVADNQAVAVGQPLLKVDDQTYRAALSQAQANVEARKADLVQAQASIAQQHAAIEQASAQLAASHDGLIFATKQLERYVPLVAQGADTPAHLDQYRAMRDQEVADEKAKRAALTASQRQMERLTASITQAKAMLAAAQASQRQAEIDLDHTVIRSSISGRIADRSARTGQYVQQGTRLMTVVPVHKIYLTANFKENQIGRMRIGQPATLKIDAFPDMKITGTVESFSPGTGSQFSLLPAENATGNFTKIVQRIPVRISIDADGLARAYLVPGLSVTVSVDTRKSEPIR